MPWKKGQSGNPLGRLPGEKQFADQLRIVLAEPVDKNDPKSVRKIRRIAERLTECALNGDPWAIAQVADRIDGKPKQESDVSVASTRYVVEVPADLIHAIGLMIRRTRTELIETIERSRAIYTPLGWKYNETDKMWRAPNEARLRFAYLERDADADQYQGHRYTRVYVEEIGTFPSPAPIFKLIDTPRSSAGVSGSVRATGKP